MEEVKNVLAIYIKDDLNILECSHKKALALENIKSLHNILNDYIVKSYFVKHTESDNKIASAIRIKGFNMLNLYKLKTNFYKLLSARLKNRKQLERKHIIVIFSKDEDKLLINNNNFSYYFNIDSLLSNSFQNDLLKIINNLKFFKH